jgi:putative SOS response-associated peptidase YedK
MTLTRRDLAEVAAEIGDALGAEIGTELGGAPGATFDAVASAAYRPRYNVAPTDPHPVLRLAAGARRLEMARWGFPPEGKRRAPLINVRSETARFSRKETMANGRCVVPADGFYEWKRGAEPPTPLWFHRPDGRLLLFAGLWEAGCFSVLTTTPNGLVAETHDRMPAILSPDEAAAWLLAPAGKLLHPAPDGVLTARVVSSRVNSVRHDDPACLDPGPTLPAQLSLL